MIIQDELPDLQRQLKELSARWRRNNRDTYNRLHTYLSDSLYGKVSTYTSGFLPVLSDSASMDIRLPEIMWAYHQADQQISQLLENFEQQASFAIQKAGDIEIASLDVFQNFQIEFIERIGASMASSIATFHSGEK